MEITAVSIIKRLIIEASCLMKAPQFTRFQCWPSHSQMSSGLADPSPRVGDSWLLLFRQARQQLLKARFGSQPRQVFVGFVGVAIGSDPCAFASSRICVEVGLIQVKFAISSDLRTNLRLRGDTSSSELLERNAYPVEFIVRRSLADRRSP